MAHFYQKQQSDLIRRYNIKGSRRFSNYWWTCSIFSGALGFLITGISSFFQFDIFPILNSTQIQFFPQGLVMCFYGLFGLVFSLFLGFTLFWNVGSGFNEFNKKDKIIRIFRWGFPGKNRRIDLFYFIKDVDAIKVEFKQGFNPKRTIALCIQNKSPVPIIETVNLQNLEKQAAELAQFLQVSLQET